MNETANRFAKVKYTYNINWNHVLYIKGDGRYSSTVAFVNGTTIQIAPDEMTYDELERDMFDTSRSNTGAVPECAPH